MRSEKGRPHNEDGLEVARSHVDWSNNQRRLRPIGNGVVGAAQDRSGLQLEECGANPDADPGTV